MAGNHQGTAGKKIHALGHPAAVNKNLSWRARCVAQGRGPADDVGKSAVKIAREYTTPPEGLLPFGSFDSTPVAGGADGAMDLYHATARDRRPGQDHLRPGRYQKYVDLIAEDVRDWSYMKFPSSRSWAGIGLVRVGPLGA